jgi:RNA polymerase sigma-B factor
VNTIEERRHEQLLRAYHEDGDRAARDRLVEEMLPLVRSLATRYAGRGEQVEDLVQVGAIGLVQAIDRFDARRGSDFVSFALPTITGEIRNHLRDRGAAIREPRRLAELAHRLRRAHDTLSVRLRRAPTLAEVAEEAGVSTADLDAALRIVRLRASVSLSSDEGLRELGRRRLEDTSDSSDDRLLLAAGFRRLSPRERRILHLRYFAGLSQAEIAREVGLSQIHVSRLIRAALDRLRGTLAGADRATSREPV